jgi:nitric oxide reductase subunit C
MKSSTSFVPVACIALMVALLAPVLAGTPAPDGKKLFTQKGCFACHTVGKPSPGPGPELTQVAYQRDTTWLRAWLADPQKIKKGTIMPGTAWKSQAEMDAVIDYLLQAKRPIPAADSTDGAKLFADYECNACHAIHKKGGKQGFPDLGDEGKIRDAAWIEKWLKDPSAVKPGTFMARFPLTPTQRKALADYIVSLAK